MITKIQNIKKEVAKVVVGQEKMIDSLLIALMCEGHILIEGVPGLAKTTAINAISKSLGIDLSSSLKQCNFDCLYCELAPMATVAKQKESVTVEEIISQLKPHLSQKIDVITLTANGEPTLYPDLYNLIIKVNKIKPLYKLTTHQRGKLLMDFGSVLYESMDRVATITLNRPERFNAISETMPDDIASAFKQAVSERDSGDPIRGSRN